MANPFNRTVPRDWREERGWGERSGARGAFGEPRYSDQRRAGYNPAGPAQGYSDGGYGEPRSWADVEHDHRRRVDYGDGGPNSRFGARRPGPYDHDAYDPAYGRYQDGPGRHGAYDVDRDWQIRHGRRYDRADDAVGFGDPNPYVQSATDGETRGPHRGRGPKDYRRSDERIREDVNDRLTDHHHLDASNIVVEVKDGEVTLNGRVERRDDKRRAEDCADRAAGVRHVQNNLRVDEVDGSGRFASSTSETPTVRRGAN
ncbi:MAG: BON domain-containing protein [Caulobacter sp.]|nr:BON domain-containing protein [Caulobacter sp.]